MPDQVVHFKASAIARTIMLAMVMLALITSWFVVRWYLGNTIAEYFNPEDSRLSTARMAVSLAPSDPLTHWRLGDFILNQLPPDQVAQAVTEFERSVSLSPNDYRYWMAWGRALEQAGEHEKAEKALREAVRLAPAYSFPRWHLGNILLRRERFQEAFSELQRASQANEELQAQLFALAWQVHSDDFDALKTAGGNEPVTRARFAQYLIQRSRFDEGLGLWNTLDENEKRANRSVAESVISNLISLKRFHTAAGIWNEVARSADYRVEIGQIVDPGFERNVTHGPEFLFGWQVPSSTQVQIGITTNDGHNSNRSLRTFFQVRSQLESLDVKQLVMVRPQTDYNFECYVKTEELVGASTPVILIEDASDGAPLATSASVPNGNNDWQLVSLTFKTRPKTEAVQLRIVRTACPENDPVCPIFGTVWYDDFAFKAGK
jgi:tetratricopeptide (TPR) repeat protein